MRSWIKLYTEILDDPDIGTLSNEQCGIFLKLLALAGRLDHRDDNDMETGRLDTVERVAWHLRCAVSEMQDAATAFTERGFLDERDGILYMTHYPDRQAHSPSEDRNAVAERVKRHRERKAHESNERVTPLQSERNNAVTPLDKNREEQNRLEEKRERGATAAPPLSSQPPARLIDHETTPEPVLLRGLHQAFQRGTLQVVTDALPTGSARAALRQLLDDKQTAADIEACARYLKAGWWRDKALTVPKLAENLGQWIAQGRPLKPNGQARASPDPAHQSPAIAAFREFQKTQEASDNGDNNHADSSTAGLSVPPGQDRGSDVGRVSGSPG
jgi:hypothetical protein